MSKNKKQTIKCDVDSCKFNNSKENSCELEEIQISCSCDKDDCRCNDETICDSFSEKNSDYNDEIYQEELIETEEDIDSIEDLEEEYIETDELDDTEEELEEE